MDSPWICALTLITRGDEVCLAGRKTRSVWWAVPFILKGGAGHGETTNAIGPFRRRDRFLKRRRLTLKAT